MFLAFGTKDTTEHSNMTFEETKKLLEEIADRVHKENQDADTSHAMETFQLSTLTALKTSKKLPVNTVEELSALVGAAIEIGYWMRQMELEAKN